MFEQKMLNSLFRLDRPAFLLLPMSVAAIFASVASSTRGTMVYAAVLLDLAVSILALFTVLRITISSITSGSAHSYAGEDEPTKPAGVNGSAPWGRKSIPDQLPTSAKWSRLSLSGENSFEELRLAIRRMEEKVLEGDLDPALEKILTKLAMALEPHIKAGYRVTSIEVRISPPARDTKGDYGAGKNEEAIPVTPKSR
ncbi:MAG: hypothetical protein QXX17_02480 [Conexivisphaerales archaeon]